MLALGIGEGGLDFGGEGVGPGGFLDIFRVERLIEDQVGDAEVGYLDEATADPDGERVGAVDDGPGNAGQGAVEGHGTGAGEDGGGVDRRSDLAYG